LLKLAEDLIEALLRIPHESRFPDAAERHKRQSGCLYSPSCREGGFSLVANTASLLGNPDSPGPVWWRNASLPTELMGDRACGYRLRSVCCSGLVGGVVLYLIAPYVAPYVFEWIGYVTCYVQQLLGDDCTPVMPTAIQD
jgi:hypothetical protein